jgi:hypothetical protein
MSFILSELNFWNVMNGQNFNTQILLIHLIQVQNLFPFTFKKILYQLSTFVFVDATGY